MSKRGKSILGSYYFRMTDRQLKQAQKEFNRLRNGHTVFKLAIQPFVGRREIQITVISGEFGNRLSGLIRKERQRDEKRV